MGEAPTTASGGPAHRADHRGPSSPLSGELSPNLDAALGDFLSTDRSDNRVRVTTATGQGRYNLALGRHGLEAGWSVRRLSDFRAFNLSTAGRISPRVIP